jgi:hypothetical protein
MDETTGPISESAARAAGDLRVVVLARPASADVSQNY